MKDRFREFLQQSGCYDEFATQVSEGGIFNDISALCSKVDDVSEWVAEGFIWNTGHDWRSLDHSWRCECGTKKRFWSPEKGFGV
jgi:hypothetical protein